MAVLVHKHTVRRPDFSTTTLTVKQVSASEFAIIQYHPAGEDLIPTVYGRYAVLADAMQRFETIKMSIR